MPKILLIGGSDGSCGAGLFADYQTLNDLGSSANVVITSVTSQTDELFVESHTIPQRCIESQIDVGLAKNYDAIKIGMLPCLGAVKTVSEYVVGVGMKKVVLDPVFQSSSGGSLCSIEAFEEMKNMLFGKVDLLTPNLVEARLILGLKNEVQMELEEMALRCLEFGSKAVLLKGGHLDGNFCMDVFVERDNPNSTLVFKRSKLSEGTSVRGTGCRLASAITHFYAQGRELRVAVSQGIEFLQNYLKKKLEVS
ncbi:MAG: bifunctional hydroxymethylpyrimidine kinase/phosphomethylpyrimidine kinase [Verrucomicrobiota bacterium]|nr:bifunctional hydroxymethylpyrimidine kinase/phosphomethylpyrimidine kinase [Verrucomicrobiota bacterium]|tara:strand:- start:214 stop:969 length:756 start_codon:yes stop_codon:yes gene_type:complete